MEAYTRNPEISFGHGWVDKKGIIKDEKTSLSKV